ncbi:hypothetical protein mRhiFer1_008596 [Rhinolophus ferrumequinum]|uniref:Uncharacterized protein n=1 Tax=Rhinolophus ferrumequinum TaxID=59479 RepID=A0A7J7UJM5_RHIFE|nr:hypothetical protein mRhiFer1_008596 [Rhinolophus ferrumequinum]
MVVLEPGLSSGVAFLDPDLCSGAVFLEPGLGLGVVFLGPGLCSGVEDSAVVVLKLQLRSGGEVLECLGVERSGGEVLECLGVEASGGGVLGEPQQCLGVEGSGMAVLETQLASSAFLLLMIFSDRLSILPTIGRFFTFKWFPDTLCFGSEDKGSEMN